MKLCDRCKSNKQAINFEKEMICRECALSEAQRADNNNNIDLMESTENTFIDNGTEYNLDEVVCEVSDKIDNMDDDELEQFLNGGGW